MWRRWSVAGLVLVLAVAFVPVHAKDKEAQPPRPEEKNPFAVPVPAGIDYQPDLTYCTVGDQQMKLDLARPAKGAGPFPVVVCVHGGGWHLGTRKIYTAWLIDLAQRGYAAAAVSYRLTPKDPFPAQIHDVKCAVRWLRANADKYKLDRDRFGAMGDSAGGHLVLLLGCTTKKDELEGNSGHADQSSAVQCVVSWYSPTDLTVVHETIRSGKAPLLEGAYAKRAVENLLGGPPEKVGMDRYLKCSPVSYVRKDAPPTLLVHGDADRLVPLSQSEILQKKLREMGAEVTLLPIEKGGHGFRGKDQEKAQAASLEFLGHHLKPTAPGK